MGKTVTRLFEQFQPEAYELWLHPDRDTMTFRGRVTISGKKTGRPSQRLTFHQKELKITKATLTKHDKKGQLEIAVDRINHHGSFDEVRLHSKAMLYPGQYQVSLEFKGAISRQMNGIYPCYFTEDGQEKVLIATQFESHHAREAFPCIDEPEAKATFHLALVTPEGEVALSNTPVETTTAVDSSSLMVDRHRKPSTINYQLTTFESTPRMSTYLLAFVFGELGYTEATTKSGVVVRAYATSQHVPHTAFALEVATQALDFYNRYFDIPYPLAKCDLIALPDFASGAMENWGLITYREQALLVDSENTSLHLKQYVANVIAHELTHQWFGNLVTMRWWTDLWLNESFASWMSYLAVDHLFPDWKVWTQFIVDEQGLALKQDALEHTHPIEVTVRHPDEIRTIFDAISYEKGASVLLMLYHYLGDEPFRDGLRLYLKRHAYANTDTVDLWAALEEVSERPVKTFMHDWTSQSGYPIVHAELGTERPALRQERFYVNPGARKHRATWPIPLKPSSVAFAPANLDNTETKITGKVPAGLVLNHERTGFYRVVYDAGHLAELAKAVRAGKLSEPDRLAILSDSFEAAKAGYGSTVDTLRLMEAYSNEASSVVWDIIAGNLGSIRNVMDDDKLRAGLKPYVRRLVGQQLTRLGWEERSSDSHFDLLLRPTILGLASYGEEPAVVREALARFARMKQPEDVHPDLRGVIYGTVARRGEAADFDKLAAMHHASTNSEQRVTLAGALTGFQQHALLHRALDMITTDEVRLQDVAYWVAYSFMNRHARRMTWDWLVKHWGWLATNLGTDLSFSRMPVYAAQSFSDAAFIAEFEGFFHRHLSPAFERPVNQAIEIIHWQSAWKDRDLQALIDYLKSSSS